MKEWECYFKNLTIDDNKSTPERNMHGMNEKINSHHFSSVIFPTRTNKLWSPTFLRTEYYQLSKCLTLSKEWTPMNARLVESFIWIYIQGQYMIHLMFDGNDNADLLVPLDTMIYTVPRQSYNPGHL